MSQSEPSSSPELSLEEKFLRELFGELKREKQTSWQKTLLTDQEAREQRQAKLRERIEQVLKKLSHREREIIRLRYGLGDGYSYTLEEVSNIFKVTRERIRQIEARAVRKLQQRSKPGEFIGYLD